MAKYVRFEDLPVWNAAIELAVKTFELTETGRLKGYSGFRDQIERAAVSVSNNIAEGLSEGRMTNLFTFSTPLAVRPVRSDRCSP